jgi:hypothetical protein
VSSHTYDAFISYSHQADRALAPRLQRLIRRVGQPWYRRSHLRVFRDKTNLAVQFNAAAIWRSATRPRSSTVATLYSTLFSRWGGDAGTAMSGRG